MSSLSECQDWGYPIPTRYGPGRVREIAELCRKSGVRRPLVVTDRGSRELPFIGEIERYLAADRLESRVFSGISPNPRDDEVDAGCQVYLDERCDGIVAVGGGSGMDGAKAIGLTVKTGIDLMDFEYTRSLPELSAGFEFPPLFTIPTTAGTGAETEATAMVTETERMMKWCVAHPELRIRGTILDPEVTTALPPTLTAWTGCDALVHAIEAYCVRSFYPLCDGAALEALSLIWTHLPTAYGQPGNIEARGGMLVGSYLAGISFLKGLGLVHAISHVVGAEFDTHHGLTNAIVLPAVLKFNAAEIGQNVGPMCDAIGLSSKSFDSFYEAVCGLLDELDIPRTLAEIGVPEGCVQSIATKALEDSAASTNPRPADLATVASVIEVALVKGR